MLKFFALLINFIWSAAVFSAIQTASVSFESGSLPQNWSKLETAENSSVSLERGAASDGEYAVSIINNSYQDIGVEWQDEFEAGQLSFDINQVCDSFELQVDGFSYSYSFRLLDQLESIQWTTITVNLPAGEHTIGFLANDYCRTLKLDNITYSPIPELENPYHLNQGAIAGLFGDYVYIFNGIGNLLEKIQIPRGPEVISFGDPSDVIITEDGEIVVYSDGYPGTISIYSPLSKIWRHFRQEGMGNSSGRLANLNGKIYITNWGQKLGMYVFDMLSHRFDYFHEDTQFVDIVAKNGGIYVTTSVDSETPTIIQRLNADTLSLESQITISDRAALLAVDDEGNIYSKRWDEIVEKYSPTGLLINSISVEDQFYQLDNIVVQNDELFLVVGGELYKFNLDLNHLETFEFPMSSVYDQWVVAVYGKGTDTDNDGMSDRWEAYHGLLPDDFSDAELDPDNDGLSNLQEFLYTTQPHNADSDNDSLSDGDEVAIYYSSPTIFDTDEDGLSDGDEVNVHLSSPLIKDTDEDGLSDSSEVNLYLTSPISADTDTDGLPDQYEVLNDLNPLLDDSDTDIDSDGLTNFSEFLEGTDPNDSDSDKDNLSDGDEVNLHASSPINSDTDGDRIEDGAEIVANLDPIEPSDALLDNDKDGYDNLWEYFAGSDLNDASDIPKISAWNNFRSNHSLNPYVPITLDVSNFESLWHLDGKNHFESSNVIAVDGNIFLKGNDTIKWVNSSNGELIKSFDIDGTIVAYDAPYLYIEEDGLKKINVYTGELAFDNELRYALSEPGSFYDGVIYGGGGLNGRTGMSAVAASSGEVLWENEQDLRHWGIAVDDNYVYNHTYQGLVVRDRENGEELFTVEVDACSASSARFSLASKGRAVLMSSSYPGCIAVIDINSGSLIWKKNLQTEAGFVEANGVLYALYQGNRDSSFDTVLQAYDMSNGNLLWDKQLVEGSYGSSMLATNNLLFVSKDGYTLAIDLITQEEVWSFDKSGELILGNDGNLYISTTNDGFYAIKIEVDTDGDGIDDWYERLFQLNFTDSTDRDLDKDEDGLDNFQEFILGTRSDNNDSDFDGLADGLEIEVGSNPTKQDSDGDSITDGDEYHLYGTSPVSIDTDGDGLPDDIEILELSSDPNSSDSDLDGMPDLWEYDNGTNIILDDSANDLDGDQASNLSEYEAGTDPQNPDTDGDLLVDGWELEYGFNPLLAQLENDPDKDGLDNYYEYLARSNPLFADTDSDGMSDGWERLYGLQLLVDDSAHDPDEDGASNLEEYEADTNPVLKDSSSGSEAPSSSGGCAFNPEAKFDPLFLIIVLCAFAHLVSNHRKSIGSNSK
jgi:hypothetical protein